MLGLFSLKFAFSPINHAVYKGTLIVNDPIRLAVLGARQHHEQLVISDHRPQVAFVGEQRKN